MISVHEPARRINAGASPTLSRRYNLPDVGVAPPIPKGFLRKLKEVDSGVEVVWNGWQNHWVLYRVTRHSASRAMDLLLKEFDLCGPQGEYRPLGGWVIDEMRRRQLILLDPNPDNSGLAMVREAEAADAKRDKEEKEEVIEIADDMHTHLEWAKRGRTSQMGDPDFIPMDRPKTGKKRIWGKESPRRDTVT